jgi:hypothetical protein
MKIPSVVVVIVSGLSFIAESAHSQSASALQNRGQEKQNWCWNACSEMVLDWKTINRSQTEIAQWAVGGADVGNSLDAGGIGPFRGSTSAAYFRRGVKQVLRTFGPVPSQRLLSALSWEEVKDELDANRPFIYALRWYQGSADVGGHVGVARQYMEGPNMLRVEDPWPTSMRPGPGIPGLSAAVPYNVLVGDDVSPYVKLLYGASAPNNSNRWTQTLVLGKSLDIVFVIDTTGSMTPYIANVQSEAQRLIDRLRTLFDDVRLAIVEYRDIRSDGFNSRVVTPFTKSTVSAKAGIASLRVGDGGDKNEALFTAIFKTAQGEGIGAWRKDDAVARQIILMGDAPGHDPEPWANPVSVREALNALSANDVSVQAVHVGTDARAYNDFSFLAANSRGRVVTSGSSVEVAELIEDAFVDIETGRFPVGSTTESKPTFTFEPPGGEAGGAPLIKNLSIQLETYDAKRNRWRSYRTFKIKDPAARSFTLPKSLPPGRYRWRLAGSVVPGKEILPDGTPASTGEKGKFVEETYVEFDRAANPPRTIQKITPTNQTPKDKTHVLEFRDEALADAFAVRVLTPGKGKPKTYIFKRAKTMAGSQPQTLKVSIKTKPEEAFSWFIQGLNLDRKKVDEAAWN